MKKAKNSDKWPLPAPIEFAGQWVAWNEARTEIIAHGTNVNVVHAAAIAAGHADALLQKVRRPDVVYIGGARMRAVSITRPIALDVPSDTDHTQASNSD